MSQAVDRETRAAQWDGYKLPEGKFVRFVDRQKGYALWHPADWKDRVSPNGIRLFQPAPQSVNMLVLTEDIPEGFGVANYTSSYLQGLRNQPTVEDSVLVRRAVMNGLEWREISYDIDRQGSPVHQTMWVTAVGTRAYAFALTTLPADLEKDEALFKRIMLTVRIGAAGHWDEEFEELHSKFAKTAPPDGQEIAAALLANELRAAKISFAAAVTKLAELFSPSLPIGNSAAAALDLLADADPQIRAAAITALGKAAADDLSNEALVWALSDKDAIASSAAASALAARGQAAKQIIKARLAALAETPAPLVRLGMAAGETASRELIAELLGGDNGKQYLAAMILALALPKFDQPLPLVKLLTATEPGLKNATAAVMQKHFRGATGQKMVSDATAELVKLLRGEQEWWAVFALGEIAPPEIGAELKKRMAEVDARLAALGKPKAATNGKANGKNGRRKKASSNETVVVGKVESFSVTTLADFKTKSEDMRLALARGELDKAVRKIAFRESWSKTATDADRQKLQTEFSKENSDLSDWAKSFSMAGAENSIVNAAELRFDAAKMANAPTTGETIFPKTSVSYLMAPNFAATMERLDAALSGVQMGTVRDQMTLGLVLKILKTNLADKTGVSSTGDVSTATGIDLKAPISMANWTGEISGKAFDSRSAVVVRVTDRARFERLLLTYHDQFGDLNSFTVITAALSRFAGLIPAAVPVVFAAVASDEARNAITGKLPLSKSSPEPSPIKPFEWVRRETLGGLAVTVFDKPTINANGGVGWESLWLTYLGETAIVASSQSALIDALQTAAGAKPAVAESAGFAQARREQGEIVFFSDLKSILKIADTDNELAGEEFVGSLLKAFGAESGALRLTANSWETVFNIALADNQFTGSFKPFRADSLVVPRELLPATTTLYAGAVVDPTKLFNAMKKMAGESTFKLMFDSQETDDVFEKQIVPEMQGEIGLAIVSFKPLYDNGDWPATVFAARLKNGALAEAMKSGKLFPKSKRLGSITAFGSPVISLAKEEDSMFAAVTGEYLLLADSVETLKQLEAAPKEKFSTSRDFVRSLQNAPNNGDSVTLFATYNLQSAFEEAAEVIGKGESQQLLPFISALVNAFHSQRVFFTSDKDGLRGNLSVSFDREGRYAVGDLAARSGEFDVANASIRPKGLSVIQSPLVEAMTLRVVAKRPGLAQRVRDDLAKFPWQKIESSNDNNVVVTANARRIPESLTVKLPVTGAEFAPYLSATPQINSSAPQIVELGKQIAGNDKDGRSIARKIGQWTYQNLKWKKVESDVVDTLASREADCLEHAELYVALARSLGLPARVVTGAALGGGAFGAHAWVEVYLGKWVELDPTWGLMDHVDATHLRFDGDAFTSYAMLNQIELEITAARRTVAEFQRDPVRLVKEFSQDESKRELAFDLSLTVEQTLGAERWNQLDDKQRNAVIKAFERTVAGMWDTWNPEFDEPVRVIRNEPKGNLVVLTILRGEAMLRLTLSQRDGAWFIAEHELVDDALPEFADALNGALNPAARRGVIYETSLEAAMKQVERLIAAEGEKPELLLLKYRVLDSQQNEEELARMMKEAEDDKDKPVSPQPAQPANQPPTQSAPPEPRIDRALELLKEIATRWPDFALAQLTLGRELLTPFDEEALSPLSKDAEAGIAALQRYAQLVPDDPRVWRELAQAYEQLEKPVEAETAYRAAIERDRIYLDHHAALVNFLLNQEEPAKARTAFAQMLKIAAEQDATDEAFEYLADEEGFDPDSARLREDLLLAFPKEIAASQSAQRLLADLQEAQNKIADAIKSTQRAIAIEATVEDYESLSRLYRQQRRFTEALAAANQALKLDDTATYIQFERACSLAQLGRKREAIAALKLMTEAEQPVFFDADDPDLQPLAAMPEFKAIKEKMREPVGNEPSIKESQGEATKKP
ncbi:MAG: transglutaminase domain-containing protein [Acidobacteriota bacterium]|nr:transglutaminase domain-containing protein [Acidobacteriota bacterium]